MNEYEVTIILSLKKTVSAVIWRGPRKNGMIKQFLKDVDWGDVDYLIIDTPPGTSDEHLSIVQYLSTVVVDGVLLITTPQVSNSSNGFSLLICPLKFVFVGCSPTRC